MMGRALLVMFVILLLFGVLPGIFLWPYTLNTWLEFLNKPQTVKWWHGMILGVIPGLGHATIPVAALTWILMLVLK